MMVVLHVSDDDDVYSCEATISNKNITWRSYQVYTVPAEQFDHSGELI